jgi:hypothetical protein
MVLDYLGLAKSEDWLWQRLSTGEVTPFPNVEILADELGLVVAFGYWRDDLTLFGPYIEVGLPVLVAVDADVAEEWPYFDNHAVVVVGFDDSYVYVHDPSQAETPFTVDAETFLLAWSRRDYEYAVLRLTEGL